MKVQLKDVHANPFRDIERYTLVKGKVSQLVKSIESTEFWDNIVARKRKGGGIEIAYGHHRLEALRQVYEDDVEFNFIIKPLDDEMMIRIMANENLDEWGHDSDIERETVRAIVEAYGAGKIHLEKPTPRTTPSHIRYAPSFSSGDHVHSGRGAPYVVDTIHIFLGGTLSPRTIQYTLQALEMVEQKSLKESQLRGLSSTQARTVVEETNRSIKQAKALRKEAGPELEKATPEKRKVIEKQLDEQEKNLVSETARSVSGALKGGGSKEQAKSEARDARVGVVGKEHKLPEIDAAAIQVARQLRNLLDPDYQPAQKLKELIKFKKHLSEEMKEELKAGLRLIIEYAEAYDSKL